MSSNWKRRILLLGAMLSLSGLSNLAAGEEFLEGQVWAYQTRSGEEASTLLINKVEQHAKLGPIFHVTVSGVAIMADGKVFTRELPHLPLSLKSMQVSCTHIVGHSAPNPAFLPGYLQWKGEFDAGRAGIYTISVAQIVSSAETAIAAHAEELKKAGS